MKSLHRLLAVALAAFFIAGSALAQSGGTVTLNAFAIGLGAGQQGFKSVLCTGFAVGTGGGAAPTCRVIASADIPASVALTGVPTAPTAAVDTNTTQLATTAFVLGQAAAATPLIDGSAAVGSSTRYARADHIHPTDTTRSPLASPTFTGVPAAPTAAVDTNTTQIATTAYVIGQAASATPLIDGTASVGTSTRFARGDHVHPTDTTRAPLASPALTGTPTAPTAAVNTNTTQIATAAYVIGQTAAFTGHGDSAYTILATDRTVGTNAAFTASRIWTLPAANAVNPGQEIVVADFQGTVTGVNTLVISRAGADTVNGGTSATISAANGAYLLKSDGSSKWTAQALGAAAAGGVSSVTCGTGLSGGTITVSGTCAVQLSTLSNSLGANVTIPVIGTYVDGPSVAQGTSGTWLAFGSVNVVDTNAAGGSFLCRLWDGTTIVDSAGEQTTAATQHLQVPLSGVITSPAANIRISCTDSSNTTGLMSFNNSSNGKDSTITVVRIQ